MSLVAVADLQTLIREEASSAGLQAALDAAEAAVAAYLGTSTLAERSLSETHVMPRTKTLIELRDGPLTALTSVAVDGSTLTLSDIQSSPWAIGYSNGFDEGATVVISFTAGWTSTNLPASVKQAVLLTAASIYARPDAGVARLGAGETITVYRKSYLSADARLLLRPWRKPRWS